MKLSAPLALLAITAAFSGISLAKEITLFNGKDLSGWEGNKALWSVEDGAITGKTAPSPDNPQKSTLRHNTFLVWKEGKLENFELRFKYRIPTASGNSGAQYRSLFVEEGADGPIISGYQADFEAGTKYSGILYEERGRGILALRSQQVKVVPDAENAEKHKVEVTGSLGDSDAIQASIKQGDWNDYLIVAKGNHLQHFINGKQTVDVLDEQLKARTEGFLALQMHAGPPMTVQFKDIVLKELPPTEKKKRNVLMIAGRPSHGPGQHEHNAGVQLLAKCLREKAGDRVNVSYTLNGEWPDDASIAKADTILIYSDGGGNHPAIPHLTQLDEQMKRGCGFVCLHYAVEPAYAKVGWPEPEIGADGKPVKQTPPAGRSSNGAGSLEFKQWLGGYFEQYWSVNPHWDANFARLPFHPISYGVHPFTTNDEWYYHMRFRDGMKRVTPILSAVPPASTTERGEGPHAGNPEQKKEVLEAKVPQHVAWSVEREDGGRGFGFTGGHFHTGWKNDDQRKLVLNAILWTAKAEIPSSGVTTTVTDEDMLANLDPKPAPKPKN